MQRLLFPSAPFALSAPPPLNNPDSSMKVSILLFFFFIFRFALFLISQAKSLFPSQCISRSKLPLLRSLSSGVGGGFSVFFLVDGFLLPSFGSPPVSFKKGAPMLRISCPHPESPPSHEVNPLIHLIQIAIMLQRFSLLGEFPSILEFSSPPPNPSRDG